MESMKTARPPKAAQPATRDVPLTVVAKGAREVLVTGDFTQWKREGVPLRKGANDEWRVVLALAPGEYQYRLVVDGCWQDDSQAQNRVPNPYGGHNAVLQVPART